MTHPIQQLANQSSDKPAAVIGTGDSGITAGLLPVNFHHKFTAVYHLWFFQKPNRIFTAKNQITYFTDRVADQTYFGHKIINNQ